MQSEHERKEEKIMKKQKREKDALETKKKINVYCIPKRNNAKGKKKRRGKNKMRKKYTRNQKMDKHILYSEQKQCKKKKGTKRGRQ